MLGDGLSALLGRCPDQRTRRATGYRYGHRERQLVGSFGPVTIAVPRARPVRAQGQASEWRSATLPAHKQLTKRAEAVIAGNYLAGTDTRRVKRALAGRLAGALGKDTVRRAWHKVRTDPNSGPRVSVSVKGFEYGSLGKLPISIRFAARCRHAASAIRAG